MLATFPVLISNIWLIATILYSADKNITIIA